MTETYTPKVREAVAIFQDEASLDAAIDDLEEHGFDRNDISLMASEQAVRQKLGDRYEQVADAADDPSTPRQPVVMPEDVGAGEGALVGGLAYVGAVAAIGAAVASGGALVTAAIAGTVAGVSGGLAGGWLAQRIGERRAREVEDHLKHGGLLLWVHIRDPQHEQAAVEVLSRHAAESVRVHDIAARDPLAPPPVNPEKHDVGIPWLFRLKS